MVFTEESVGLKEDRYMLGWYVVLELVIGGQQHATSARKQYS